MTTPLSETRIAKQQQFVDHVKELRENLKTMSTAPTMDAAELIVIKAKQMRESLEWLIHNNRNR